MMQHLRNSCICPPMFSHLSEIHLLSSQRLRFKNASSLCICKREENITRSQITDTSQAEINNQASNSPECVKIIVWWHFCFGEMTARSRELVKASVLVINKGLSVIWHCNQRSQRDRYISYSARPCITHPISLLRLCSLTCIFSLPSAHLSSCLQSVFDFLPQSCFLMCF